MSLCNPTEAEDNPQGVKSTQNSKTSERDNDGY